MHKEEIFSLLKLIEKTKISQLEKVNFPEDFLPIIYFVMINYYENKICTLSNLSSFNNIPFNTAKRKINSLVNSKLIYKTERLKDGKHYIFLPTPALITIFEKYLDSIKSHIGKNFGFTKNVNQNNDWYYGGNYFKSKIIPPPIKTNLKNNKLKEIKFLIWQSSAHSFLSKYKKNIEKLTNIKIKFIPKKWESLKKEIVNNSEKKESKYDLVFFDNIWLLNLIKEKSLLNISEYILSDEFELSDFYHEGMHANRHNNNYYGIPFQVTMHNLCYRKDLFMKYSLSNPENIFDVLRSLKILHKPKKKFYGISFPGAKGIHLGHFFCNLLGATFNTPLFDFPKIYKGYDTDNFEIKNLSTNINKESSINALEYLKELFQYAHPNVLNLTQGLQHIPFFNKEVSLAFIWSGMMGPVDLDNMHPLYKKISRQPFPISSKNQSHIFPLGGFNIGIPNNINNSKIKSIWNFLIFFTSSEFLKKIHSWGGVCTPRYSLIHDPDISNKSNLTKEISNYSQNHKLQNWMRPSLKNTELFSVILGDEIHEYLQNNISAKFIANKLENKINLLVRNEN